MNKTGADVVAEAHEWIGTPFHPQASLKGVGADCKGLVWGVARAIGDPAGASPWAAISNYDAVVPVRTLREGLIATMDRVTDPRGGDVLLLKYNGKAQHLGILAGNRLIHTWPTLGRVDATSAAGALMVWPLDSVWRFRSVEG